jgi:hypothetical protein
MSTCHVLALPDFGQPFIWECDASGEGIGAVLMQNRHPLAYESRKLRGPELLYTICNVPTLGHHYITEGYDDQSSQMEVVASTKIIERCFGVRLTSLILIHHYDPFRTDWLWFRCILTISMILSIWSYRSIKFIEEVILGTILGGTS